ncbi:ISPs1a-2 [Pseudomonas syringae pv. tomato]|nr:ISPs1a-2 [Pseudomonas syringae pv. tomato]RMQ76339.1 ISPs1a-2 [Pseudomonas syringae pv. tomato]
MSCTAQGPLLADKGYDAEHLRHYCDRYRIQPVIPLRAMPRKPRPGLPRVFDSPTHRQRNIIERMSGWLKENRRIGTRYDRHAKNYAAMVTLACSQRCMRQYFSCKSRDASQVQVKIHVASMFIAFCAITASTEAKTSPTWTELPTLGWKNNFLLNCSSPPHRGRIFFKSHLNRLYKISE